MKEQFISQARAESIAQKAFSEQFQDLLTGDDVRARLSLGFFKEGTSWVFKVSLLPRETDRAGLRTDLEGPPSLLIAEVLVDQETGDYRVAEHPEARKRLQTTH